MRPILKPDIAPHAPRTLQRWTWERTGRTVVLAGVVIFLGTLPRRGMCLDVALLSGDGALLGASVARLESSGGETWPISSFRAEFDTGVEPPYRLRVQLTGGKMPLTRRERGEMIKLGEAQIRPWKRRELPSSS